MWSRKKCGAEKNVEQIKMKQIFFVFHGKSTFLEFSSMDIHFLEFKFHGMSLKPVDNKFQERTFSIEYQNNLLYFFLLHFSTLLAVDLVYGPESER